MRKAILFTAVFILALLISSCAKTGRLRCNLYVTQQMEKKNIYLPDTTANAIDNYMSASQEWTKIPRTAKGGLDHSAAHKAAKSGNTVLASYNAGAGENGHIVIINGKKKMEWSAKYNANVPYASGSVNGKKPEIMLLSYQFSADKQPKMNYYIYVKKKK